MRFPARRRYNALARTLRERGPKMIHLVALAALTMLMMALGVWDAFWFGAGFAAWLAFYATVGMLVRLVADIGALLRGEID